MKILITGASGTIGKVLMKCLAEKNECIGIDKIPSQTVTVVDIANEQSRVLNLLKNVDVVIHLAWDVREAGTQLNLTSPENKTMGEIMYALSLEQKVKRFILASSVHVSFGHINYRHPGIVENHETLHEKKVMMHEEVFPLGTYGASKAYLETLGKAYSEKGLQVIAVRFGNVTDDDNFGEYPFWLSHKDCCQFIEKCIEAEDLPKFSSFFAISGNPCNPFNLSDARTKLEYNPKDKSECPNLR